ncbi:hypothetical protein [Jannaschia marina]|uniref:hypothetical protein n=1 Tax=Jannaschia marina TaxID=2741674 RepID=UPI0015CCB886|nr:hypothetical protein [Jannaschia marina]
MGRLIRVLSLCLLAAAPARAELTLSLDRLAATEAPIVTTTYGAMRVTETIAHVHAAPPDKTLTRVATCLRDGALRNGKADLAAYDWPGERDARSHELCLLALFLALGDRAGVNDWVAAVIAPAADPECPAVWDVKQAGRWGPARVHVWRSRVAPPLAIDVLDRAGAWSEELRAPVHSLLRVTYDPEGRPLAVKYDAFTFGDRYGLARCG